MGGVEVEDCENNGREGMLMVALQIGFARAEKGRRDMEWLWRLYDLLGNGNRN